MVLGLMESIFDKTQIEKKNSKKQQNKNLKKSYENHFFIVKIEFPDKNAQKFAEMFA